MYFWFKLVIATAKWAGERREGGSWDDPGEIRKEIS